MLTACLLSIKWSVSFPLFDIECCLGDMKEEDNAIMDYGLWIC